MKGRRIPWPNGRLLQPGEYSQAPNGTWYGRTPNGHMANLAAHTVKVHEDHTISVEPSIKITAVGTGRVLWHGFLRHGYWKKT
jgi:hypothetical protein